jgi:hypothetical protein
MRLHSTTPILTEGATFSGFTFPVPKQSPFSTPASSQTPPDQSRCPATAPTALKHGNHDFNAS